MFFKGAIATVNRDFGGIGKYMFHGIIKFHMIHHLFPKVNCTLASTATS